MTHRRMQQTFTALAAVIAPHLRLTRSEKELKVTALLLPAIATLRDSSLLRAAIETD